MMSEMRGAALVEVGWGRVEQGRDRVGIGLVGVGLGWVGKGRDRATRGRVGWGRDRDRGEGEGRDRVYLAFRPPQEGLRSP